MNFCEIQPYIYGFYCQNTLITFVVLIITILYQRYHH